MRVRNLSLAPLPGEVLYCPACRREWSAYRGDYFMRDGASELMCDCRCECAEPHPERRDKRCSTLLRLARKETRYRRIKRPSKG